jgi:chromosome partitioning protein
MSHPNQPKPDYSDLPPDLKAASIVVIGNEKGGSGKSTTAMQTAIGLMRLGYKIGTIDLDARQGTLTRMLSNRFETIKRTSYDYPSPLHFPIEKHKGTTTREQEQKDRDFLMMALAELSSIVDFIIIDTPGSDSYLSHLAHAQADLILTPLSLTQFDTDVLFHLDPDTGKILRPAIYTHVILNARKAAQRPIQWLVMLNRLNPDRQKTHYEDSLEESLKSGQEPYDFTLIKGFSERPIFHTLFAKGLSLLDVRQDDQLPLTPDLLIARQEIRCVLKAINPVAFKGYPLMKNQTYRFL